MYDSSLKDSDRENASLRVEKDLLVQFYGSDKQLQKHVYRFIWLERMMLLESKSSPRCKHEERLILHY